MPRVIPVEELRVGNLYKVHLRAGCHTLWKNITDWDKPSYTPEAESETEVVIETESVFMLVAEIVKIYDPTGYWINALVKDKCGWFWLSSYETSDDYITEIITIEK